MFDLLKIRVAKKTSAIIGWVGSTQIPKIVFAIGAIKAAVVNAYFYLYKHV